MNQKRGLGRGLASLIPAEEAKTGFQQVRHDSIVPNPHQPRSPFRDQDLVELAASIQEHGIIQPLVVTRRSEGGYQLIAGERRWRAARLAGLREVPVIIKEAAPQQMLELALVENVQRADLNPLEEALAYQHLVEDFGLSQTEVARRVGKSRVAVTNTLRLLQASPKVQAALAEQRISEGHARALLGLETQAQQDAALRVVLEQDFNVRQTESLVQKIREGAQVPAHPKPATPPEVRALEERFQEALGTRVKLRAGRKGGRVIIYYYSDEEFQTLYAQLTGQEL
ncbi:MAG: ParB/RepB/Spo0J family partition protein [Anaerolineae bacterium]|nr:ParB/RepB/Spo0J family partition protein [Anaerolineae bacterium]